MWTIRDMPKRPSFPLAESGDIFLARKRFGQNFLVDPATIHRIVQAIAPKATDLVLEIGPGRAALTGPLLQLLPQMTAVEIDRDLAARLRRDFPPERLHVVEQDALTLDLATIGTSIRLVGNLPYNISTPLLFLFARQAHLLRDLHVMLQKEVVDRISASAGTADYGRLSVMMQYHFIPERLFLVPPGSFRPPPKVDSAVLRLLPRSERPVSAINDQALEKLVQTGFAHRRKTLRNNLRGVAHDGILEGLGIRPEQRPEEIDIWDWVRLENALHGR